MKVPLKDRKKIKKALIKYLSEPTILITDFEINRDTIDEEDSNGFIRKKLTPIGSINIQFIDEITIG